jgi:radical SAM superfamily enzyme YgiQ (UPF0313 family)
MYKNTPYVARNIKEIESEIDNAANAMKNKLFSAKRAFLADGDVMALDTQKLLHILMHLKIKLPSIVRVGTYANSRSINNKSVEDLKILKEYNLSTAYIGLESGSENVLKKLQKRDMPEDAVAAAKKLSEAGIKLSVMVLVGAGGLDQSKDHALKSAEIINRIQPPILSLLSMTPVPGTQLSTWVKSGNFRLLTRRQNLCETRTFIENTNLNCTVFRCNHSSNAWPLEGRFPRDKARLISEIDMIINSMPESYANEIETVPAWML